MITTETALFILLFTYGFILSYHIMGSTKFFILKEFDWKKALLGIFQEIGYCLFLFLLFKLPEYVDITAIGIDLDFQLIISVVLVFPLTSAIEKAYSKAVELRQIDVSNIDEEVTPDGEENEEGN